MRAWWWLKSNAEKVAGHGSKGPSRARANSLLSRASGKLCDYPTHRENGAAKKKPFAQGERLRLLTNPTFFGAWGFVFQAKQIWQ
ncbi:hypothetical protein GGD40_004518 [Paraburkholderia bryophila]|uniref:Uncharacterized protein n=1 Tax=Paraburkholderia bryophila TaxID=420952 RepID=A0A7Y9WQN5_9BURK|nr:hypothetical protein [Paraburkholderia bryophila]